nr:hypothetical protein [Tanacetum cinerariifolium]
MGLYLEFSIRSFSTPSNKKLFFKLNKKLLLHFNKISITYKQTHYNNKANLQTHFHNKPTPNPKDPDLNTWQKNQKEKRPNRRVTLLYVGPRTKKRYLPSVTLRARVMYQDESGNSSFYHAKAWAILRQHAKWDAPEVAPVELTEDETGDFHATVNTDELLGADPRPCPPVIQRLGKKPNPTHRRARSQSSQFGEFVSHELRLKREAAEKTFEASKDKDETIKSLKELQFLALSTKDLSDDDVY